MTKTAYYMACEWIQRACSTCPLHFKRQATGICHAVDDVSDERCVKAVMKHFRQEKIKEG